MEDAFDTTWEEVPQPVGDGEGGTSQEPEQGQGELAGQQESESGETDKEKDVENGADAGILQEESGIAGNGAEGEDGSSGTDVGAGAGGSDTGGSEAVVNDSGGNAGTDSGQGQEVSLSDESVQAIASEIASTYEGVKAEDFQEQMEMVNLRADALFASSVVLVVALFFVAGIAAVDNLIRSTEKF